MNTQPVSAFRALSLAAGARASACVPRAMVVPLCLALLAAAMACAPAQGQTVTWQGGTGLKSWSTATNWDFGLPGSSDDVVFPNTITAALTVDLDAARTVKSVTFNPGTGGSVLLQTGTTGSLIVGDGTSGGITNSALSNTISCSLTVNNNATVLINGTQLTVSSTMVLNNNVTVNVAGTLACSSNSNPSIANGITVTKTGGGTWTMSPSTTSPIAGKLRISAGKVTLLSSSTTTIFALTTTVVELNGGTLQTSGNTAPYTNCNVEVSASANSTLIVDNATNATHTLASLKFAAGAGNATLTVNGSGGGTNGLIISGTTTLNGDVGSATFNVGNTSFGTMTLTSITDAKTGGTYAGFIKSGVGTLVLSTATTTIGNVTTVQGGTLKIGADDCLPTGTTLTLGNGANSGTFDLNGRNQTVASLATSGTGASNTVTNSGAGPKTFKVDMASGTATYGGVITGAANLKLTKAGNGTQVLAGGTGTYTGGTAIDGGILELAASVAAPLGTVSASINTGGTLVNNQSTIVTTPLTLNGGTLKSGSVDCSFNGTVTATAATTSFVSLTGKQITLSGKLSSGATTANITLNGSAGSTKGLLLSNTGGTTDYSGTITVNSNAILTAKATTTNSALGLGGASRATVNLNGGTLQLNSTAAGGGNTVPFNAKLTVSASSTLTVDGTPHNDTLTMDQLTIGAATLTITNQMNDAKDKFNFAGPDDSVVNGNAAIQNLLYDLGGPTPLAMTFGASKLTGNSPASTLTLAGWFNLASNTTSGANPFNGTISVDSAAKVEDQYGAWHAINGLVVVQGDATTAAQNPKLGGGALINAGAKLKITEGATSGIQRIGGGVTLNGGTLDWAAYQNITHAETISNLTLNAGRGSIILTSNVVTPGVGDLQLTFPAHTRAAGGLLSFTRQIATGASGDYPNLYINDVTDRSPVPWATVNGQAAGYYALPDEGLIPLQSALYATKNDGNWGDPAVWTGNIVPSAGDGAIVRHSIALANQAGVPTSYSVGAVAFDDQGFEGDIHGAGTTLTVTLGGITVSGVVSPSIETAVAFGAQEGLINVLDSTQTLTLSGAVSGSGGLTKFGPGTLLLSSANSYSGATSLLEGTLSLGDNYALGSGALTIMPGTTIAAGSGSWTLGSATTVNGDFTITEVPEGSGYTLTFTNDVTLANSATLTLASDTGAIFKTGIIKESGIPRTLALNGDAGVLRLEGANTFSGGFTLGSGTVQIGNDGALGGGTFTIAAAGTHVVEAYGSARTVPNAVSFNGDLTTSGSNDLTFSGIVALNVSPASILCDNAGVTTFAGVMQDGIVSSVLVKKGGPGTMRLTNANTFGGNFEVFGGTVQIGNDQALGNLRFRIMSNGVVAEPYGATPAVRTVPNGVDLNADFTISGAKDLTFAGTLGVVTLGVTPTITVTNTGTTTFASAIGGGSYGLTKAGPGLVVFTGNNTYTGVTSVNGGMLRLTGANGKVAGGVTVNAGGTCEIDNTGLDGVPSRIPNTGSGTVGVLTLAGGTFKMTGGSGSDADDNTEVVRRLDLVAQTCSFVNVVAGTGSAATILAAGSHTQPSGSFLSFTGDPLGSPAAQLKINTGIGDIILPWATVNGGPAQYSKTLDQGIVPLVLSQTDTLVTSGPGGDWNTVTAWYKYGTSINPDQPPRSTDRCIVRNDIIVPVGGGNCSLIRFDNADATISGSGTVAVADGAIYVADGRQATISAGVNFGGKQGVVNVGAGATLTISGTIPAGSTAGVAKVGAWTLVLDSASNAYKGGSSVLGGTLSVKQNEDLGDPAGGVYVSGGTFAAMGTFGLTGGGGGPVPGHGTVSVTSGSTGYAVYGTDTWFLSETQPGDLITVSGETQTVADPAIIPYDFPYSDTYLETVDSFGIDKTDFAYTITHSGVGRRFTLGSGGGTVYVDAGAALTLTGGLLDGTLNKDMPLTKTGTGTLVLSKDSVSTGLRTINAGTIKVTSAKALGMSGTYADVVANSGGTLELGGVTIWDTITLKDGSALRGTGVAGASGIITVASNAQVKLQTGLAAGDTLVLSGYPTALTGGGGASTITVGGDGTSAGTVRLTYASDYGGAWTVAMAAGGLLDVNDSQGLGQTTSPVTVTSGTLAPSFGDGIPNAITLNGGTLANKGVAIAFSGPINVTAASSISLVAPRTASGQTVKITGVISNTGSVGITIPVETGANGGTLILTAANTLSTPVTIGVGTVQLSDNGALLGNITIGSGAKLFIDERGTTKNLNRLGDGATLTLNGGTLKWLANLNTTHTENVLAIKFGTGSSTMQLSPYSSAATFGDLRVTTVNCDYTTGASLLLIRDYSGTERSNLFITNPGDLSFATVSEPPAAAAAAGYDTNEGVIAAPVYRMPENPDNTANGINFADYLGSWSNLPDFSTLTPNETGVRTSFDINPIPREDQFAFKFTGYVDIPRDGVYTFGTNSDDGSALYIGNTMVVNNDGLHGGQWRYGSIGLKAGKHAITATMFEQGGGQALEVRIVGPGVPDQTVPASMLYIIGTITKPTITPNGGSFGAQQSVVLTTTPFDASMFYTLDGSTPTINSNAYNTTTPAVGKAPRAYGNDNVAVLGTGTITVAGGSTSVTGTGTKFVTDLTIGSLITASDHQAQVVGAIADDTHLTTKAVFGSALTDAAYSVANRIVLVTDPNNLDPVKKTFGVTTSGSNVGFTAESGEPQHCGSAALNSAWWVWQAPLAGNTIVSTAGSAILTRLAVYTSTFANPYLVSDLTTPAVAFTTTGTLTFTAAASTWYYIAVDGASGATGSVSLSIMQYPNDNLANAIPLLGTQITASGANVGFGVEPSENAHEGTAALNSAWWSWTAPNNWPAGGEAVINTYASSFLTRLAVYTGPASFPFVPGPVTYTRDTGAGTAYREVAFTAAASTTYYIAVDGVS
ncbi:MAG: autotransporter-associated beta strand repeat-containing protein, partial [Planctomycetota bacterium]|nr:autotransporter-associated beta strand repeat-containing protein [Planctomycetota bacterium]